MSPERSTKGKIKVKRKQSEETKKSSGLDSVMTHILELSDRKFKIAIINILRALMEKVDKIKE